MDFVANSKINIIGQGLVGSILAHILHKKNIDFTIYDAGLLSSSQVAAGIFNPITGKRMVKTWMADDVFPFLLTFYKAIEEDFGIKILYETPIFKPFHDVAEQNHWMGKSAEDTYKNWIEVVPTLPNKAITNPCGGLLIKQAGWLDVNVFLSNTQTTFKNQIKTNFFNYQDHGGELNFFCEGAHASKNELWKNLSWQLNKGEILDIEIQDYSTEYIVNKSVFIVQTPQGQRVGSTYHHHDLEPAITENGVIELKEKLETFLTWPYKIKDTKFGIRPATKDRRPFIFEHDTEKNNFILNGFGSKAVSLAPYFVSKFMESQF